MDGYAHEVIDKMFAAYHVTAMRDVAARVLALMRTTDPRGAAAALRGRAERPDYREVLAAVRAPVLIVVGADDAYPPRRGVRGPAPPRSARRPRRRRRGGRLPGVEQPERCNAVLPEFLATRVDGADT